VAGKGGKRCGRRRCAKIIEIPHLHDRQPMPANDFESGYSPGRNYAVAEGSLSIVNTGRAVFGRDAVPHIFPKTIRSEIFVQLLSKTPEHSFWSGTEQN
jgi:hypothetical protein